MPLLRLRDLPLRRQLLVVVGLPMLLVVLLSVQRVQLYRATVAEAAREECVQALVETVLSLVYHLQVERGMAASHSGGAAASSVDLAGPRAEVDGSYDELARLGRQPEVADLFGTRLTSFRFELQRQRIAELRERTDEARGDFLPTFELYGFELDRLIELVLVWGVSSGDPRATRGACRLHTLQRLQEHAGRVRGTLAGALAAGTLDPRTGLEIETWIREERLISENPETIDLVGGALDDGMSPEVSAHYEILRDQLLRTAEKARWREQMKEALGYTGMIHQFKNYVLRGDAEYRRGFSVGAEQVRRAIERYRALGTSPTEEQALQAVQSTVENYRRNLVVVDEMRRRGATVEAIDRAVRTDDAPAQTALRTLDSSFRGPPLPRPGSRSPPSGSTTSRTPVGSSWPTSAVTAAEKPR